jgi:hypothetical protein
MVFLNEDQELIFGWSAPRSRHLLYLLWHSILARTIPHGSKLTVAVTNNPHDVFPVGLVRTPFTVHPRPRVVHLHAGRAQGAESLAAVGGRLRISAPDVGLCERETGDFTTPRILQLPADVSE